MNSFGQKGGVPSRISKLESFPNPLKVEKLGRLESLKEAGNAMMGDPSSCSPVRSPTRGLCPEFLSLRLLYIY